MTDLTEQWKKDELPIGEYYLLYKDGTTDREYYDWVNVYVHITKKGFSTYPNDIEKILAPVPTFEQWQAKLEENARLKELLKECKEWLEYLGIYKYTEDSDDCVKLLSELNEVLK